MNVALTPTAWVYLPYVSRASGVYILSNHSYYVNSSGYLNVYGEVYNGDSTHFDMVKVSANLYDGSGQLIDTSYDFLWDNLPAGEKSCFAISLGQHSNWARYEFENPTYWTYGHAFPNITLINVTVNYDSSSNQYTFLGQARNDHGAPVSGVAIIITLYEATGRVIGCGIGWPNDSSLDPGQTSSFKITFYGSRYANVASYRIQVDGDPQ